MTNQDLHALIVATAGEDGQIGGFLPRKTGYQDCVDLDGAHAAEFLAAAGFEVLGHRDIATNGVAWTRCGIVLSTNGYCSRSAALAAKYDAG